MKVRIGILVLGVLLGLVCKWALSDGADANSKRNPQPPAGNEQSRIENTTSPLLTGVDPLVPPASIDGVLISTVADLAIHESDSAMQSPFLSMEFSAGERALFEPHGDQVCASGCAASRHPTNTLTQLTFRQLLARFAHEPIDETSTAFEELLYYGRQAREMLRKYGAGPLDDERASHLRHELDREFARISIRVVDEAGEVRSSLPPTSVPLDRRHVFSMDVNNVQPLVTSGTVKRVGLDHLWTRL